MISFKEYLNASQIEDQNIDATAELVSFTNKNGKKFVYPIVDLEQCLQALWIGGDAVKNVLGGNWQYEESKFRQAFSTAFGKERSNSVASNLGSQTPNTVRCLELFAYFKLNRAPTRKLEKPDILRSENLDALFYGPDLSDEFQIWLRDEKELSDKSVASYLGAVSGLLSDCAGKKLLCVGSLEAFAALQQIILKDPTYIERNTTGNQMYSSALNHFSDFLHHRLSRSRKLGSEVPFDSIASGFSQILTDSGFRMTE